MNIRARLSLTFFTIVIIVLVVLSASVYYFAENHRRTDFSRRLQNRAINTARVITEVDEVDADLQRRLEENNPATLPGQYIVIIDSAGTEIYRSTGPDPLASEPVPDAVEQTVLRYEKNERSVLVFVFKGKKGHYTIIASAWDQTGKEAIANLLDILIGTFCMSVVLVSGLSWFYSGRVLKPIARIISEVDNINDKSLNLRLDERGQKDELGKLARTFNSMLSRLQNSFVTQKNFIANASHEIKTPITIMSGEIEVTLLQERDKGYYARVLQSVLKGLRRLNNLSTQLLLLAESSHIDPDRKFSSLRLDDVLWETKEWLQKAYPDYQVDIQFDIGINPEAFFVLGDEHLMRAAILNLMDNGCKYSPDKTVSITVDSSEAGVLKISFSNFGTIPAREIQNIFSPFYRAQDSKSEKGFGIGLSLVRNVIAIHGGEVRAVSQDGVTEFTVRLPVAAQP